MEIGAYTKDEFELLGRKKIYTDADHIDSTNVITVLQEALLAHERNKDEMVFLLQYEKGHQPLKREKIIRPEIDVKVCDNLANQITEFKLGYHWGNPITFVQRGDKSIDDKESPAKEDDGITLLNALNDQNMLYAKDQEMARYIEITGIGYQMVDIRGKHKDGDAPFEIHTLNPLFTFCVYRNDIRETKMMSVSYRELQDGTRYFTCITDDRRYEVKDVVEVVNGREQHNWSQYGRTGELNPIGEVPVVEYLRSYDRTGAWERAISDMDALNIEVSDFANSCAQATQEIWWMNDADFPIDPTTGEKVTPKSGQWMRTVTAPNGNRPMIQALSGSFNYDGVQNNILSKRDLILQKCYVPLQSDPGGGSTASAMSMSSGWAAAEAVAAKQENITRASKMELLHLELLATQKSGYLPFDNPLMTLKESDVQPKFTRQKTFDLGTKTNAMVAMINAGVNGRIAMQVVDLFPDVAQAWEDSREMVEARQKALVSKAEGNRNDIDTKRHMSDTSDQGSNSPLLDGMKTGADYAQGGES